MKRIRDEYGITLTLVVGSITVVIILGLLLFRADNRLEEAKQLCYPGMLESVSTLRDDKYLVMCSNGEKRWVREIKK